VGEEAISSQAMVMNDCATKEVAKLALGLIMQRRYGGSESVFFQPGGWGDDDGGNQAVQLCIWILAPTA